MSFEGVDAIVRAVLYEGYVLYPYRSTSIKNRQRFTFGGVYPRAWSDAHGADPFRMKTECLVRGGGHARVSIVVRFLHLLERLGEASGDAWHEAAERTVEASERGLDALVRERETRCFVFEATSSEADGVVRRHAALAGEIDLWAEPVAQDAHRLTVEIRNVTPFDGWPSGGGRDRLAARDAALLRSFASTHTLVRVDGGEMVSLADPPDDLRAAAAACQNVGAWPILVGEPGRRDVVLSSPIILEDHPRVAPESPLDLFDATEIDEILLLRIMTLTDAEKAEMRALDARSRALLDRVEALGPDALLRLHGTSRHGADVDLRPGDRVRLRPGARGDVLDVALAGMDATIASVERDYEGRVHFAVTVDADPGRDLGVTGQPGHRFFFRREELERR